MSDAPAFTLDPAAFAADPYPALAQMRREAPIANVPALGATLITRHADVIAAEPKVEIFSSRQPQGLMTRLMGENMMRKDGHSHMAERRAILPAISPRTVAAVWKARFVEHAEALLAAMAPRGAGDILTDYAMALSGHALRHITGLVNLSWQQIDAVSQGMIDGIANYLGDPEIEARCNAATALIDEAIDERLPEIARNLDHSLIAVQLAAGLDEPAIRANVKLAISGGQNEPRDAIAGAVWALLTHDEALAAVRAGEVSWLAAFEEYARWISPIGMSPREVHADSEFAGVRFAPGDRVFLMFGSANRDEAVFEAPDIFDVRRDNAASVAFGAGPHFCAGAWASRCLIAEVALPMLFDRLPRLRLDPRAGPVEFTGWAFRGPRSVPCRWD